MYRLNKYNKVCYLYIPSSDMLTDVLKNPLFEFVVVILSSQ